MNTKRSNDIGKQYASELMIMEFLGIDESKQRANRLALADMLEHRVTDEQFDMTWWTNYCGTIGCALGIAALSGEFNGLGWNYRKTCSSSSAIYPVVGGRLQFWEAVGGAFFGPRAFDEVFQVACPRSREHVARELRAIE